MFQLHFSSVPRENLLYDASCSSNSSSEAQQISKCSVLVNSSPSQRFLNLEPKLSNGSTTTTTEKRVTIQNPTPPSDICTVNDVTTTTTKIQDPSSYPKTHIISSVSLSENFSSSSSSSKSGPQPKLAYLDPMATPWNEKELVRVLQNSPATKQHVNQIAVNVVPYLSHFLQKPLIRLARQMQRLSMPYKRCTKHEVFAAARVNSL